MQGPATSGYCSANLQVGILESIQCPPEGVRYKRSAGQPIDHA